MGNDSSNHIQVAVVDTPDTVRDRGDGNHRKIGGNEMTLVNGRRKFFWSDEIKDIDAAIQHTLDCIAVCSDSEYESDKVALGYFKAEYYRLAEVRAEAVKNWLAIW